MGLLAAIWFAQRFPRRAAYVATGIVQREDVLAVFLGREENEIVCRNIYIKEVQKI